MPRARYSSLVYPIGAVRYTRNPSPSGSSCPSSLARTAVLPGWVGEDRAMDLSSGARHVPDAAAASLVRKKGAAAAI